MDQASFQFVLFGLAAAVISNFSRNRVWRSCILMLASMLFLGMLARSPYALLPLAGFLILGYVAIVLLRRGWSRALIWCVSIIVFVYIWLKKYLFLPEGFFLHVPYFTLGLSYIFFRVLHLMIATGEGTESRKVGFGSYLLYTLNFTTFVSGPIQLYDDFARDQFAVQPIPLGPRVVALQLERIVRGFFKVNVLAMILDAVRLDALVQISQPLPPSVRMFAALRVAVLYPLFLYANFSGYIDIVIASARLMRVRLPENFDRPFSASSFLDFWSRWHITLSNWLKMYVYNPLLITLMRRVSSLTLQTYLGVLCFFVTFFLVGIWHGRTSEFAFFGVLQGGGVAMNKFWQLWLANRIGRKKYKALAGNTVYVAFGRGLTFSWFAFTLFWFWSNWEQMNAIFSALGAVKWLGVWVAVWLFATAILAFWEWLRRQLFSLDTTLGALLLSRYARAAFGSALAVIAFVLTILLNQSAPPIVYKAF